MKNKQFSCDRVIKTANGFEAISASFGYIGVFASECTARAALRDCHRLPANSDI